MATRCRSGAAPDRPGARHAHLGGRRRPKWLSVSFDEVADDVRAGHGRAGSVAAPVLRGQVDRIAVVCRGGWALPDPGDGETGLALEEPVGADSSGCPSLGWVVGERG